MDPELLELYGAALDHFEAASRKTEARGVAPERVADAVVDALTARKPRTRYLVGTDAKAQALLRRLLPDPRPRPGA